MRPPTEGRRPTTGATTGESLGGDENSVQVATVVEVGRNADDAAILTVSCCYCGGRHRHGLVLGDPALGGLTREAGCGRGQYLLPSGVIA